MKQPIKPLINIDIFKKKIIFSKKLINITDSKNWTTEDTIFHSSKKFFQIHGYFIKTNFPKKKNYYQPLIHQNEVGFLAILLSKINNQNYFLLQLKAEPGNKNTIQLSPTIQATKSNYTRVHKGKKIEFLNYLKKKQNFIVNTNQPEQGSRYLNKLNKNVIIKVKRKISAPPNFIWLTTDEILQLSKKNNILNMYTILILSCFLRKNKNDKPVNSLKEIHHLYNQFKKKYFLTLKKISLLQMKNWVISKNIIFDLGKNFFSIQFFRIKTNFREVTDWSQPLISDHDKGLNILFCKTVNETHHFLCKILLEPGYKIPKFTCTIMNKNDKNKNYKDSLTNNMKLNIKTKLVDVINSDEGGRFNNNKSRNIVHEVSDNYEHNDTSFVWISYNQMLKLLQKKLLTIELRNLFGNLNKKKIDD